MRITIALQKIIIIFLVSLLYKSQYHFYLLVVWPSHVKANSYINLNEFCPHPKYTIWRKTGKPHTNRKKGDANSTYGKLKNTHDLKIPVIVEFFRP